MAHGPHVPDNSLFEVISLLDWTSEGQNIEHCASALYNLDCLRQLCALMADNDLLKDFMTLLALLLNGKFFPRNLTFLLCLERAKWENLTSSTNMRFQEETKRFWAAVLLLGKGKILHLLGGKKSLGNVMNGIEHRGNYDPGLSSVNFVIPSREVLRKCLPDVPKKIKPGFVPQTADLLDKTKQHVIMYDGKKIAPGLGKFPVGDVNLGGLEGPPSLAQKEASLHTQIELCDRLGSEIEDVDDSLTPTAMARCTHYLSDINLQFTRVQADIQKQVFICKRRMSKLQSYTDTRKPDRYKFAIANEKGNMLLCRRWLKNVKTLLTEIGQVTALLRGNIHLYRNDECVDLTQSSNYLSLHDVDIVLGSSNVQLSTTIVKQRTEMWRRIRNTSHLSGSTAWNALGMRGMKEYRDHFKTFILQKKEKKFPATVQQRIDHGTKNEVNAIATCVTFFMPAILPPCYIYKEQGIYMIDGQQRSDMICISPDGLIVCKHNQDGKSTSLIHSRHKPIALEIKCPYPSEHDAPLLYTIPTYYSLQILLEMKATKCDRCWYLAYSTHTSVLHEVTFNQELCQTAMEKISLLYDTDNPTIQSNTPSFCEDLKRLMQKFIDNNSRIIYSGASRTSSASDCDCTNITQAHHIYPNADFDTPQEPEVLLMGMDGISKTLFKEGFELLREKAHEILAGVICDTTRIYNENIPSNMPICYGLKSFSFNVSNMRDFVEDTRNHCLQHNIRVLTEAFDGQWASLVFNDIQGHPLTRFQLHLQCWRKSASIGKRKLLSAFQEFSAVSPEVLEFLTNTRFTFSGSLQHGNVSVEFKHLSPGGHKLQRVLYLQSTDTDSSGQTKFSQVRTPDARLHPNAWQHSRSFRRHSASSRRQSMVDIDDVVQYIPEHIWDIEQSEPGSDVASNATTLSDRDSVESGDEDQNSENGQTNQYPQASQNILSDILFRLQKSKNSFKYVDMSQEQLYFNILADKNNMGQFMTVSELDIIATVINEYTHKLVYKRSSSKSVKVNALGALFGDEEEWVSKHFRKKTPKSLASLAQAVIMCPEYPRNVLASIDARIRYTDKLPQWESESTTPLMVTVPHRSEEFKLFCYPEFSLTRNQLEPRILDPTHILNNVRSKICRSGIDPFPKRVVEKLANSRDPQIRTLMLTHILDQQNAEISLRFFSTHVEETLKLLGEDQAAEFVRIFRNWFLACDARGIAPEDHIYALTEIHDYLLAGIDLSSFPGLGRYVKGIPRVTVEGILHNCSMRIILYYLADNNSYCHRAIGTGGIECFYSLVSFMDFQGQNCPKAAHLEHLMSQVISLNHIRHDPNRNWKFDKRRGQKYPSDELMEKLEEAQRSEHPQFRFHLFDVEPENGVAVRKKSSDRFGSVNRQETGMSGMRLKHYKIDTTNFSVLEKIGPVSDSNDSDCEY